MSHRKNDIAPAFIKLGKIGKAVESKMDVSLASDVNIYLLEAMANAFAQEYPDSYLTLIEEISNVIRKPDAISFDQKKEELHFVRLYAQYGQLFLLDASVARRGSPRRWVIARFCAHKDLREFPQTERVYFERI